MVLNINHKDTTGIKEKAKAAIAGIFRKSHCLLA